MVMFAWDFGVVRWTKLIDGRQNGVGRAFTSSNSGSSHYANRILMNAIGLG